MKLTVIGSADAFNSAGRGNSCYVLESADAGKVMIDFGPTALLGLRRQGIQPNELSGVVFTHLHGDHIGGEREVARSLISGEADAACMIDGNHLVFITEGTLPAGATRVVAQTAAYDHCNFTVGASAPRELLERFRKALSAFWLPEVRSHRRSIPASGR